MQTQICLLVFSRWRDSLPTPDHLPSLSECLLHLSNGFTKSEEWRKKLGTSTVGNVKALMGKLPDKHC